MRCLFATRMTRRFAYGFLSIVFVLCLVRIGLSSPAIGLLLSLTVLGDAAVSLWITTRADRVGRRRMPISGSVLMVVRGLGLLLTRRFELLLATAMLGVISPSGNEVGPFLTIEQAALAQFVPDRDRTRIFDWYNLAGSVATAIGALVGGWLTRFVRQAGFS